MKGRSKTRTRTPRSVRRSVTIPAELAVEVERVARERHLTIISKGRWRSGRSAAWTLKRRPAFNSTPLYGRFMSETDPESKGEAGKELIRAIFGKDAVAENTVC